MRNDAFDFIQFSILFLITITTRSELTSTKPNKRTAINKNYAAHLGFLIFVSLSLIQVIL